MAGIPDVARYDLHVYKGTTFGVAWPILSNGTPVDLTGWTVKGQVRASASSPTVLHEWNTTAGNVSTTGNQVTLKVPPSVSSAWTWEQGEYDILLSAPSGDVYPISFGNVFVRSLVTR